MHLIKWIPSFVPPDEKLLRISRLTDLKIAADVLIFRVWEYCPRDAVLNVYGVTEYVAFQLR